MDKCNIVKDKLILELLSKVEHKLKVILGDKLKDVILYGSYARQEHTRDSDIDIMALIDDDNIRQYEDNITDIMVDISLEYDVVLSIITENYQTYNKYINMLPYFNNIKKEGVSFYGQWN